MHFITLLRKDPFHTLIGQSVIAQAVSTHDNVSDIIKANSLHLWQNNWQSFELQTV